MLQIVRRWYRFSLVVLATLVLCLGLNTAFPGQTLQPVVATQRQPLVSALSGEQKEPYAQVVQQGIEHYQAGKFAEAIALWKQALPQISSAKEQAIVNNNLALAYRQTGQLAEAIAQWEQAIQIYRSQDQAMRQPLAGLLIEQAQAYSDLGQQRRAIPLLQSALELTPQTENRLTEAAAQGALGNAYWALGNYGEALKAHQTSLKIARELNNTSFIATALNNLGNIYVTRAARYSYQANAADLEGDDKETQRLIKAATQDRVEARTYFEQSVQIAKGVMPIEEVRGLLNLTRLLASGNLEQPNKKPLTKPDWDLIVTHWNRIRELLNNLPDSRDKAYGLINLAEQELKVGKMPVEGFNRELTPREELRPTLLLNQALTVARNIGNARAESFAIGSLGQLYEGNREYGKAMELTRRAQFAAQQISAPDSLYRWQWQVGRLLKAMGAREEAIAAYEQAIATLQSIRGDIVVANQELQFDFREQVEPVYRELMALLLESPATASRVSSQSSVVSSILKKQGTTDKGQLSKGEASPVKKVVDTLELLKLAELQNFFGDECVQVALSQAGDTTALTDANTVVVYSVILDGQSQMILRSPNGSMKNYPVALSQEGINKEIDQLRYLLELRQTEEYLPQAQKIYNLLIRPLEADLAALKPSTVVFINDGVLRKVPMAALHDGKAYLIEKYAIATTPSLSLTNRQPSNRNNLEALSVGLTVERAPFAALSNVQAEVKAVNKILGGTELIDNTFTLSNLQAQLQKKSYPVVHIATHGKFGVDAESTFLVGFDQRISIENLDNLLRSRASRQSVELLTLSACQTAAGDNRSALGIAGIAVRAGVESAVATLWYINDEATVPLIEEFYRQLRQPNITKAEALRKAQLKMIADVSYNHPAVWSPFILIGNWL